MMKEVSEGMSNFAQGHTADNDLNPRRLQFPWFSPCDLGQQTGPLRCGTEQE